MGGFFAPVSADAFWDVVFHLTYTAHGGSGTNLTLADVLDLDWTRTLWWGEKLNEERRQESEAIKRATRSSKRR
jgi:hypothetical protein